MSGHHVQDEGWDYDDTIRDNDLDIEGEIENQHVDEALARLQAELAVEREAHEAEARVKQERLAAFEEIENIQRRHPAGGHIYRYLTYTAYDEDLGLAYEEFCSMFKREDLV